MPISDQVVFSELVRELRNRLSLSQERFAAQLGVSFRTVNRWENGRAMPQPMALKLIKSELERMGESSIDLLHKYFPTRKDD